MDIESAKLFLAKIIVKNLKAEFADIHLSGNLADTIKIKQRRVKGSIEYDIEIPASIYNISLYRKKGVIIYTGTGSYATSVDQTGGFSGRHTDYIDRCIQKSLQEWASRSEMKIEVK